MLLLQILKTRNEKSQEGEKSKRVPKNKKTLCPNGKPAAESPMYSNGVLEKMHQNIETSIVYRTDQGKVRDRKKERRRGGRRLVKERYVLSLYTLGEGRMNV